MTGNEKIYHDSLLGFWLERLGGWEWHSLKWERLREEQVGEEERKPQLLVGTWGFDMSVRRDGPCAVSR